MMVVANEDRELAVIWRGGSTFNVHTWRRPPLGALLGEDVVLGLGGEVDVFTRSGDRPGNPPNPDEAFRFANEWLARPAEEDAR